MKPKSIFRASPRRLLLIMAGAALTGLMLNQFSAHAAELQLVFVEAEPGAPVEGTIELACFGEPLSGIQFDLLYDPDAITLEIEEMPTVAEQEKTVATHEPERGALRVLIVGMNANPLADGAVLKLRVVATSEEVSQDRRQIRLGRAAATTPEGQAVDLVIRFQE